MAAHMERCLLAVAEAGERLTRYPAKRLRTLRCVNG
nr:MAG TPA: hypothetical protein [Caudoviricetes sp.]